MESFEPLVRVRRPCSNPGTDDVANPEQVEREAELVVGGLAGSIRGAPDVVEAEGPAVELQVDPEAALDLAGGLDVPVGLQPGKQEVAPDLDRGLALKKVGGLARRQPVAGVPGARDLHEVRDD